MNPSLNSRNNTLNHHSGKTEYHNQWTTSCKYSPVSQKEKNGNSLYVNVILKTSKRYNSFSQFSEDFTKYFLSRKQRRNRVISTLYLKVENSEASIGILSKSQTQRESWRWKRQTRKSVSMQSRTNSSRE